MAPSAHPNSSDTPPEAQGRSFLGVFRYSRRALGLVWQTNRRLTVALGFLTLVAGILPAAVAWVGALIIDSVVAAAETYRVTGEAEFTTVFGLVALE
ncbi:MAG: ABC transporter ATP-binding protein, partial [Xanthomonadales bacterium]|nr:ABC transporter ATP-binding protein [Xanthomonadales bacterium]